MSSIDATLDERGRRYGIFMGHADITQTLKQAMQRTPKWTELKNDQREALDMIAHKIGRILNGDPDYIDSWHDIVGYTRLVEQRLEQEQNQPQAAGQQALNFPNLIGAESPSSLRISPDGKIVPLSAQRGKFEPETFSAMHQGKAIEISRHESNLLTNGWSLESVMARRNSTQPSL